MSNADLDTLKIIEKVHTGLRDLASKASKADQKEQATYALRYLEALAQMVIAEKTIFEVEPWHVVSEDPELDYAGEMLLRVKDPAGKPMSPYQAVMTLYHNSYMIELDMIVCKCALAQFRQGPEKQVSINVSGRSLLDPGFVKMIIADVEKLRLRGGRKVILEIHESNAAAQMSDTITRMFRHVGIGFAIDDVGLSMSDVFRLSAFENIADYIKLDRQSVSAHPENPASLKHVLGLARSLLPRAKMVAEGIQNANHAREVTQLYPDINYVQGVYLPPRDEFTKQWGALGKK